MDMTGFGIKDMKYLISAVTIRMMSKTDVKRKDVIHQPKRKLLHVFFLALASYKFSPRLQKVINTNDIFERMSQLNFHSHNAPPSGVLPVLQKFVAAYKLWQAYLPHFPKTSRYTLGEKTDSLFVEIIKSIVTASYLSKQEKLPYLKEGLVKLDVLKFFLQVAWEIKALDNKKYITFSEQLNEIGRMLGGWRKGLENKTPAV